MNSKEALNVIDILKKWSEEKTSSVYDSTYYCPGCAYAIK